MMSYYPPLPPLSSDVSPPVWNLRAVIWFHFAISSLVLLPSPVTLSALSFSACWSFLLNFFQKILQYFLLRDRLFCVAPVWRLGEDSWSVVCAACCLVTLVFAVMHLYSVLEFFCCFCLFLFYTFLESGIGGSTEWSAMPACPGLVCFFNRGGTEGTGSLGVLCPMFVCVLFYMSLCHDWFCCLWMVCSLMTCVQGGWEPDWTLFLAMM